MITEELGWVSRLSRFNGPTFVGFVGFVRKALNLAAPFFVPWLSYPMLIKRK